MIEYVEIRNAETSIIGIIDTAKSIIWHSVYFGVGDFEIYVTATPEMVNLLTVGAYVTRPDNREVGIIESIVIGETEEDGKTIIASGRFAKSILDRRLIYNLTGNSNKATILSGNVENAVRQVVKDNAIACEFDGNRNIDLLILGAVAGIPHKIVSETGEEARKQVSYGNLLTYTDGVLEEYGIASTCILEDGKLQYIVYSGTDRSADNSSGNIPVIFSREFDNLTSSEYAYDESAKKNVALIGGAGEGVERFYSLIGENTKGLQRRETWIDAASISRTYKDENDVEQSYSDADYKEMLDTKGKQDIAPLVATETFSGQIDISNGNYIYGRDFSLGDIVTVQDNAIGKYVNVRIRESTEVQDENGYNVEVNYQ